MVIVIPAALLVVVALLVWQARNHAAARKTIQIAATLAQRQMGPGQAALRQTVDALAYEEVTAVRIEGSMRDLVPLPQGKVTDESPMQPLLGLLETLEKHSVITAGMEQVLLNVLDMPMPVDQVALYWYAGEIGQNLHAAAQNILMYIESGHLTADVVGTAANLAGSVIHETLTQPGQAFDLLAKVVEGAAHGNVLEGVATHFVSQAGSFEIGMQSLHVLVEHMGQHAELLAAGHQLADTAGAVGHVNALDGFHGHFPWVTALLSVHREMALLAGNTTTAGRALENVGLDVAGTGIGAWGGGHVGAVVGTAIFPGVGTAFGGLVGAIAGAVFLRHRTNKFKARHLHAAEEQYQQALDKWHAETAEAATRAVAQVHITAEEARTRYIEEIGAAPRLEAGVPPQVVTAALRLRGAMQTYAADTRRLLKRSGKLAKRPRAPRELAGAVGAVEGMVRVVEANMPSDAAVREYPLQALDQIAALPLPLVAGSRSARTVDAELQRTAAAAGGLLPGYRRSVTQWGQLAAARYKDITEQLALKLRDQFAKFREVFEPLQKQTELAYAAVKSERAKLGIKE